MNLNTVVAEEVYSCITSLLVENINYENKLKEFKLRKIDHDVFHYCIRKEYQNGNQTVSLKDALGSEYTDDFNNYVSVGELSVKLKRKIYRLLNKFEIDLFGEVFKVVDQECAGRVVSASKCKRKTVKKVKKITPKIGKKVKSARTGVKAIVLSEGTKSIAVIYIFTFVFILDYVFNS